jgi:hypothetical protein
MNDKTISLICLAITLIGIILFTATYKPEFEEKTINWLTEQKTGKAVLKGRIDYVIKNYPITTLILNDGNKTLIYYPKATTLETNDFVTIYAEKQENQTSVYAHKIIKNK